MTKEQAEERLEVILLVGLAITALFTFTNMVQPIAFLVISAFGLLIGIVGFSILDLIGEDEDEEP